MKKEFEYSKRWRDLIYLWTSRISTVKMAIFSKVFPMFNAVLIQSPITLFKEPQNNPDIHIKLSRTPHNQNNPEKKDNGHRITIPGFILYHKDAVTKTLQYWPNKQTQRSGIKTRAPRIKSIKL